MVPLRGRYLHERSWFTINGSGTNSVVRVTRFPQACERNWFTQTPGALWWVAGSAISGGTLLCRPSHEGHAHPDGLFERWYYLELPGIHWMDRTAAPVPQLGDAPDGSNQGGTWCYLGSRWG